MVTTSQKRDLLAAAIIALIVVAVFGQTFSHALIGYDDPFFISGESHVTTGLSLENLYWAWSTHHMDIWHPLTWLSYQLETEVFGASNDGARFLTNTALHLISAWLVYFICTQLSFIRTQALIIALLFAVHPQHVEVVAWASERKELLACSFMLLSLWRYLAYLQSRDIRPYIVSLLFFVCALLSKASAMPLALLLPVIHFLKAGSEEHYVSLSSRRLLRALSASLPFLFLAVAISIITIEMQASAISNTIGSGDAGLQYLLNIGLRFAWYLDMTFWPSSIILFNPAPETPDALMITRAAITICVFLAAVWWKRSNRLFLIGIAWFILFLAPTSGVVPVEAIYVSNRYSYQSHIGLFIALLAMFKDLAPGTKTNLVHLMFFAIITVFSILSWNQTALWKNSITLFKHEWRHNPTSDAALIQLGYAYHLNENYETAMDYFKQANAINPDGFYGYAYQGFLEEKLKNYPQAEAAYQQAIGNLGEGRYHYIEVVYGHLVWVSGTLDKHEQAIQYLQKALSRYPDNDYFQELKEYYEKYYPALSIPGGVPLLQTPDSSKP